MQCSQGKLHRLWNVTSIPVHASVSDCPGLMQHDDSQNALPSIARTEDNPFLWQKHRRQAFVMFESSSSVVFSPSVPLLSLFCSLFVWSCQEEVETRSHTRANGGPTDQSASRPTSLRHLVNTLSTHKHPLGGLLAQAPNISILTTSRFLRSILPTPWRTHSLESGTPRSRHQQAHITLYKCIAQTSSGRE